MSTALRGTSTPPSSFQITTAGKGQDANEHKDEQNGTYTAAQLSRIAAQSVRLACHGESSKDAFLIVKSLEASMKHYSNPLNHGRPMPQRVAIDFGMAVSPRLAMHSLLHGLVRRGMTKKAGDIAYQIAGFNPRIQLRDRTLHVITSALCQTDTHALQDENFRAKAQQEKAEYAIPEQPLVAHAKSGKKVQLPCTRTALHLFFAAKQYRKERASQTFQQLIDACLLQGEILVVSFLLALLAKKLEAWFARNSARAEAEASSSTCGDTANPMSPVLLPSEALLSQTIAIIDSVLYNKTPPDPQAIRPSHEEAVQTLAILAGMLDDGVLPPSKSSAIITVLVSFPLSASTVVWILRKGKKEKWERRDAYAYFNEVLGHLVAKVIHEDYEVSSNGKHLADITAFNSLLQYALQRKKSVALADRILKRMELLGGKVVPDITTFNIVLRAGTLLRRRDLSEAVLEMLRNDAVNKDNVIQITPPKTHGQETRGFYSASVTHDQSMGSQLPERGQSPVVPRVSRESDAALTAQFYQEYIVPQLPLRFQHIFNEDFDASHLSSSECVHVDRNTLVAYINFLTATDRPGWAVNILRALIPELVPLGYPLSSKEFHSLGHQRLQSLRNAALLRAIHLGPQFFTAILNALVKDGRTGLAQRIWRLAKAAERRSWDPKFETAPWILPCAAYTVMMQCYAAEARLRKHRRLPPPPGAIRRAKRLRQLVRGEYSPATRHLASNLSVDPYNTFYDMGMLLLRSMQTSERYFRAKVGSRLEQGGTVLDPKTIELPVPDERFFNATLYLFGRLATYAPRKKEASPKHWRRLYRRQLQLYIETSRVGFPRDDRLMTILIAIREAGFEVPIAYKHMLVDIPAPLPSVDDCQVEQGAYARRWRIFASTPFSLPTYKGRGLPISKNWKRGRHRAP